MNLPVYVNLMCILKCWDSLGTYFTSRCCQSTVSVIAISPADGHLTYLISFAQSFIHYHFIAAKLGVNLSKQEENGSFVFVDCLTHLLSETDTSESSASPLNPKKDDEHTASSSSSRLTFSLSRLTFRSMIDGHDL